MRSAARAASRARKDFGRPTPRGASWWGMITVPLRGSNGSTSLFGISVRSVMSPPRQGIDSHLHKAPARSELFPGDLITTKGDFGAPLHRANRAAPATRVATYYCTIQVKLADSRDRGNRESRDRGGQSIGGSRVPRSRVAMLG